jgi:hypothetical protein
MKYSDLEFSAERAFMHLLIYCTLMDGVFKEDEEAELCNHINDLKIFDSLDLDSEVAAFRNYRAEITSRYDYFDFLIQRINPQHPAGIFLHVLELAVSDNEFTPEEDLAYSLLGSLLGLPELHQEILKAAIMDKRLMKIKKHP